MTSRQSLLSIIFVLISLPIRINAENKDYTYTILTVISWFVF